MAAPAAAPKLEPSVAPYASNGAYLADELRWLDHLLHLHFIESQQEAGDDPLDPFRGLVLSEQEVLRLFAGSTPAPRPRGDESAASVASVAAALDELALGMARRREASMRAGVDLLLPRLSQIFHLGPFEERCLLICLAPEIDRKYEKLYAYLQDDVTRRRPTVGLVLDLLCGSREEAFAARQTFEPQSVLLRARLVHLEDGRDHTLPLRTRALTLDERVAGFLLGSKTIAPALQELAELVPPGPDGVRVAEEDLRDRLGAAIRERLERPEPSSVLLHLHGPYGTDTETLARGVCADLGLPLVLVDAARLPSDGRAFEDAAWLAAREAVLQPAALCLTGFDRFFAEEQGPAVPRDRLRALLAAVQAMSRITFLVADRPWHPAGTLDGLEVFIEIALQPPAGEAARRLWEAELGAHELAEAIDAGALASRFRLTPGQIRDAAALAGSLARWRSPADGRITAAELASACRAQAGIRLSKVARKVEPRYTWNDLVLPPDQLAQLREIRDQAVHRHIVLGTWGFERRLSLGKGLSALFSGPPGTGKSMAAEVIAGELGLDLYRIDLSRVVSKYIGETEKNLDRVFAAAESSSAILLFDEADALFGKRSEVRDSHDRYANVEVSYLLQKMEEYEGIAILASNLRQHLDHAFLRRLAFTVHFPFPDEESRRRIWIGAWPPETPLGDDVDFAYLAREYRLTGGNIRNIVLAAAYRAAATGDCVRQVHLLHATRREFQKMGKTLAELEEAAS
ncbi:MAG TPA: ATP-binding protein [Vicinamibacterales bacterium]